MSGEELLNQMYLEDISTITFHNIYSSEEHLWSQKYETRQILFYWEIDLLEWEKLFCLS